MENYLLQKSLIIGINGLIKAGKKFNKADITHLNLLTKYAGQ